MWLRYVFILFLKRILVHADCGVVNKTEWNAVKPHKVEYIARPVNLVIIMHTDTPWCGATEDCKKSIKTMQDNAIRAEEFRDVKYSFLIGGDSKVYEGTGWLHAGLHTISYDRMSIGIAFIGNYNRDSPTMQQMEALKNLLQCGVDNGHLTRDFRVICHRQLLISDSPGKSLYTEIRKWPQWLENIDKISGPQSLIITSYAQEIGLYDSRTGQLNITGLNNKIYDAVASGDFNYAVDLSIILDKYGGDKELTDVMNNLLTAREKNIMQYVYKLWNTGGQKVVLKHFPIEFQMIFNEEALKIENIRDTQVLKMDANIDSDGDRNVWGDSKEKSSRIVHWKMITIWEENRLYFKIFNLEYKMYMKMGVKVDSLGDRNVYGSKASDTNRHQWYVRTMRDDRDVVFLIYNRAYDQVLKLARDTNSNGDRLLWGHHYYSDDPALFGWRIIH